MEKCNFWGIQTEIDKDITKLWYKNSDEWGCDCGWCRNFLALAKSNQLPASVTETLNILNIPPEKATYVCEITESDKGLLYQFSYRISGNIIDKNETMKTTQFWGDVLCRHESYPYGAPDFPTPHFDLEFWIYLPYVLNDEK